MHTTSSIATSPTSRPRSCTGSTLPAPFTSVHSSSAWNSTAEHGKTIHRERTRCASSWRRVREIMPAFCRCRCVSPESIVPAACSFSAPMASAVMYFPACHLGASAPYLLRRHILPLTAGVLLTQASVLIPRYILAEIGLSFLGLGVGEPVPSWGNMLSEARQYHAVISHPWMLAPGFAA